MLKICIQWNNNYCNINVTIKIKIKINLNQLYLTKYKKSEIPLKNINKIL